MNLLPNNMIWILYDVDLNFIKKLTSSTSLYSTFLESFFDCDVNSIIIF